MTDDEYETVRLAILYNAPAMHIDENGNVVYHDIEPWHMFANEVLEMVRKKLAKETVSGWR